MTGLAGNPPRVTSKPFRIVPLFFLFLTACAHGPPTLTRYPDGGHEPLESLRGRVVVLTFWAEWCQPCLEELPVVRAAVESSPGAELLAVYYRENPGPGSSVYRWVGDHPELSPRVRWPSAAVLEQFAVRSLPRTVVLARDGTVVDDFNGAILPEEAGKLRAALDRAQARN
jgi:cytochrome c biogenesis protein CcmG, thiol:disulfide interchange protein DsbE